MKTKRYGFLLLLVVLIPLFSLLFSCLSRHQIEAVLGSHTTGQNKIAEKGAIIIRIVNYVLSISNNDEQTQFRLYTLGKAHAKRKIRPYMYSIFVQVMLYTISAQLGTHASHEVMEAWVNMFAFIMKSMLPLAIKGQTVETEIAINTKCEFNSDNMKAQGTNDIICIHLLIFIL